MAEHRQIGWHHVTCASIEDRAVDEMLRGVRAQLLYSDPPWGDGNLKYWATMNKKMTGASFDPLTYDQLMQRIYQIIDKHVDGYVVLETGLRWAEEVARGLAIKYYNVQTVHMKYRAGKKMLQCVGLIAATRRDLSTSIEITADHGYAVVKEIISRFTEAGDTVIDPCCGMGYTAQACVDLGLRFYGNEFNAKRLAKTIKRLEAGVSHGA